MDAADQRNDIEFEGCVIDGKDMEIDASSFMIREPLLTKKVNNTSQIALIGANVSPIESLDYE